MLIRQFGQSKEFTQPRERRIPLTELGLGDVDTERWGPAGRADSKFAIRGLPAR